MIVPDIRIGLRVEWQPSMNIVIRSCTVIEFWWQVLTLGTTRALWYFPIWFNISDVVCTLWYLLILQSPFCLPNKHENYRTFVVLITIKWSFSHISSEISVCYIQGYRKLCVDLCKKDAALCRKLGVPRTKTLKFVHAMFVMYSSNPLKVRTLGVVLYIQCDFHPV